MTPSPYQQQIYNEVVSSTANIVIEATAGSGKTTTLIEISKLIPFNKSSLFCAFNKGIVDELKERLPNHIDCFTIHSLGIQALIKYYGFGFKVNEYKSFMFIEEIIKKRTDLTDKEKTIYKFNLLDIINLIRLNLSPIETNSIDQLSQYHDFLFTQKDIEDIKEIFMYLHYYNEKLSKKNNSIDFCDMIYLPVFNKKIDVKQYDCVYVDEMQDLNKCQQVFIEKILKKTSRLIAVGDKNQAIYNFAGANDRSFEAIATRPNTVRLPLSISYRCGKKIVENAKKVCPVIEPWEAAQEGEVREGTLSEIELGDMVVCRNTRPLIRIYFNLLSQGKKANIVGKDIESGLLKLIAKYKDIDAPTLNSLLLEQLVTLKAELTLLGIKNVNENYKYISLLEKVKAIQIISETCKYSFEVENRIKEIFAESKDSIKLLTGHKSKGLEADRVFYIEKFEKKKLLPSPYATQPHQLLQENNLLFVILTRAKKSLIIVKNVE